MKKKGIPFKMNLDTFHNTFPLAIIHDHRKRKKKKPRKIYIENIHLTVWGPSFSKHFNNDLSSLTFVDM